MLRKCNFPRLRSRLLSPKERSMVAAHDSLLLFCMGVLNILLALAVASLRARSQDEDVDLLPNAPGVEAARA